MRGRSGITIVEAIAAVVVMAVAVPPMTWAVRQAHGQRANAVLASRARWLACEQLEDVIADRHSSTRGYAYLDAANYPAETPVAGQQAFSRTVTVQETGASLAGTGTGYKKVVCTVSYSDVAGKPQTLTISTVLTDYTP
jgi:hypothetical protein